MEDGNDMDDGHEGGEGVVIGGEGERLLQESEILDLDMGSCRENCLSSWKVDESGDKGCEGAGFDVIGEVLDVGRGHELLVDVDMNVEIPLLDGMVRVGVQENKKMTPNWCQVVMGSADHSASQLGGTGLDENMAVGNQNGFHGGSVKGGTAAARSGISSSSLMKKMVGVREDVARGVGGLDAVLDSLTKERKDSLAPSVDEGVKKRRRGDEGGFCGGDASPLERE